MKNLLILVSVLMMLTSCGKKETYSVEETSSEWVLKVTSGNVQYSVQSNTGQWSSFIKTEVGPQYTIDALGSVSVKVECLTPCSYYLGSKVYHSNGIFYRN